MVVVGPGIVSIILALGLTFWVKMARIDLRLAPRDFGHAGAGHDVHQMAGGGVVIGLAVGNGKCRFILAGQINSRPPPAPVPLY